MAYRDSLGALRAQVILKRAALHAKERSVPPVLRALLPAHLARAIAEGRERACADPETLETMETLSATDAALDGILAAYDEAIAMASELRAFSTERPAPPKAVDQPWLIEEPSDIEFRNAVDARLALFGEHRLERWGDRGYIATIDLTGYPCLFFTGLQAYERSAFAYDCHLRANVPVAFERLQVSLQGGHHNVAKAIHLASEIETGDAAFDEAFWIKGAASTAALLGPPVRQGMLEMKADRPVLLIERGLVTLDWTINWREIANDALPTPAVDIMSAIRDAIARG